MSIIIEPKKFKTTEPSSSEMKEFAKRFPLDEWKKLCENSEFVNAVSENLDKAYKISNIMLKKS